MLGVQPLIGRTFESREAAAGADAVIILSAVSWQRYFGASPKILGQSVILDDRTYSVIGVMPPGFRFPDPQTQFWVPLVASNFAAVGGAPIARLKDGVPIAAATAEVGTILQQLRASRPGTGGPQPPAPAQYELIGLQELMVAPVKPALLVLTGAVGFVLLIA